MPGPYVRGGIFVQNPHSKEPTLALLKLDKERRPRVLLVPPPFDSLYPHYLCAMTDAALGENDRYAGEQAQYNSILAELAAWLRRKNLPARGCSWRW